MKKRIIKFISAGLVIVLITGIYSGCSKKKPADPQQSNSEYIAPDGSVALLNYDNADVLLSNPDRGLRMETYITLGEPLYSYPLNEEDPYEKAENMIEKYKEDSPALCQVYVYLSNYTDKELDSLAFEQLEKYFSIFRDNNIRMLLRFAYATESVDDAPYKIVSTHLSQLKEWFSQNSDLMNDTLYCLQTGIIGYWGEGHSYSNLKKREIKKVINDVCTLAPEGIYTQVRTYDMLQLVSEKNSGKVGIHDDYIIGDMSHQWAFIPSGKKKQFSQTMMYTKHTINDGEMPWGTANLNDEEGGAALNALDGKAVLQQLSAYSMTSLSLEHNYREDGNANSLAKWQCEYLNCNEAQELGITVNPELFKDDAGNDLKISIYDIIRYHLGYHLVLSNYSEDNEMINFSVTNYGFAAPLNFNYFALVCKNKTNGEMVEIEITDYDKDALQSGAGVRFSISVPENCEAVGVKLDTFKDRGINPRFANKTKFENGVQYFK